jgi:hypothetical protein
MKVANHKDAPVEVIIIFSNGYGDNLKLSMDN